MNIKQYIIDKSKELNIDMIGFTDCEPLSNLDSYLTYRKVNDISCEFEEKDISKRIDPKFTMPNCKSIIVIALSYNINYNDESDAKIKGILSKSSWGIDYHKVLKSKLELLILSIKEIQDFEYKFFVDTGPLVERELAAKAGLGYYGKNCNIINREYGSFIFIGYILTDLEISNFDNPVENDCGDCELCFISCPTRALESPFKLNTKKCISYLTQTKKEIDPELKKKMGIKIYGCDTCQSICPKNKDAIKSNHDEFIPIVTKGSIDIEELIDMSNKEFNQKYRFMAGSWRGKGILIRNARIILENIKNKDNKGYVDELFNKLE